MTVVMSSLAEYNTAMSNSEGSAATAKSTRSSHDRIDAVRWRVNFSGQQAVDAWHPLLAADWLPQKLPLLRQFRGFNRVTSRRALSARRTMRREMDFSRQQTGGSPSSTVCCLCLAAKAPLHRNFKLSVSIHASPHQQGEHKHHCGSSGSFMAAAGAMQQTSEDADHLIELR